MVFAARIGPGRARGLNSARDQARNRSHGRRGDEISKRKDPVEARGPATEGFIRRPLGYRPAAIELLAIAQGLQDVANHEDHRPVEGNVVDDRHGVAIRELEQVVLNA